MVRGEDALKVPGVLVALARSVDRVVAGDPAAGGVLAERELALVRAFELDTRLRVHKGHALHNIGVGLVSRDPLKARTYFHAAHAEDVRTYPDGMPEGWGLAARVLMELYQERQSAIRDVADRARDTLIDPLRLAVEFEAEQGDDLGAYVGLRSAWRDETELEGVEQDRLVFVAGTHAFPHHMKALRDAVTDIGLVPVVVMEFPDRDDDNDYTKSERLIRLCGRAVFDLSLLQGQILEVMLAVEQLHIPFFAGYVAGSVDAPLHGTGMVRGLLEKAGVIPEAVVDTTQLAEAARAWLKKPVPPSSLAWKFGAPTTRLVSPARFQIVSVPGSAAPYTAIGPNTPFLDDLPTAIPSGEGYISLGDDAMETAKYWLEQLRAKNDRPLRRDPEPQDG